VEGTHFAQHDDVMDGQQQVDIDRQATLLDAGPGFAEAPSDVLKMRCDFWLGQFEEIDEQEKTRWLGGERHFQSLVSAESDIGVGCILDRAGEDPEVIEGPGQRNDSIEREPVEARFETDDTTVGGGADD